MQNKHTRNKSQIFITTKYIFTQNNEQRNISSPKVAFENDVLKFFLDDHKDKKFKI